MYSRFSALCVSKTGDCTSEKREFHWELPTEGMLSTDDINVARAYILAGGGNALQTLVFGRDIFPKESDVVDIVDIFAKHCPNITSLSIEDWIEERASRWVSRFGTQLTKLELVTETTRGIAQYCSALRELNLCTTKIGDIDFWEKVGDNLEKLTFFCAETDSVDHLENIEIQCRNLRHIDILGSTYRYEQISKLLCSYGEQLEFAYLYNMYESELCNVVNACKNCRFHFGSSYAPLRIFPILPSLRILGHQLESTHIYYGYLDLEERYSNQMTSVWNECVNLRRLHVEDCNVEDMKAITASPKIHLEELDIRMRHLEKNVVKEVLDICSSGCKNVQNLTFSGPAPSHDTFDEFIGKKMPSLSSVCFFISGHSGNPNKYYGLAQPFLKSSVFLEIWIDHFASLRTIDKFRNCGAFVRNASGCPYYDL